MEVDQDSHLDIVQSEPVYPSLIELSFVDVTEEKYCARLKTVPKRLTLLCLAATASITVSRWNVFCSFRRDSVLELCFWYSVLLVVDSERYHIQIMTRSSKIDMSNTTTGQNATPVLSGFAEEHSARI